MQLTTRTIYSAYLQTCLLSNIAFDMAANSTLNELYGVQSGIAPSRTPTLGYYAIGNGGHQMTVGANGIALANPIQHSATDAALYHGIPFILRPINNDIDTVAKANYALRRIETHDGVQYFAYYLKRLPMSTLVPEMNAISVSNGVSSTTSFVPTAANLNPVPPPLNNSGVNLVTGDYVSASAEINIVLTADDVAELLNVANIIYGDSGYAIISEIALCSGVDKVVQSPTINNGSAPFNEAISVQCVSFVNALFALAYNSSGIDILLDVGATESLFQLE